MKKTIIGIFAVFATIANFAGLYHMQKVQIEAAYWKEEAEGWEHIAAETELKLEAIEYQLKLANNNN